MIHAWDILPLTVELNILKMYYIIGTNSSLHPFSRPCLSSTVLNVGLLPPNHESTLRQYSEICHLLPHCFKLLSYWDCDEVGLPFPVFLTRLSVAEFARNAADIYTIFRSIIVQWRWYTEQNIFKTNFSTKCFGV